LAPSLVGASFLLKWFNLCLASSLLGASFFPEMI
jgi:hypothetical protein